MTEQRVIVDALNIDYPAARVVNSLSFTLGNERLALVGESGSGKSMSARALMGLVRKPGIVSANRLNVLGNDLLTLSTRRWQALRGNGIAMVLQDPRYALNPAKNVAARRAFTTSSAPSDLTNMSSRATPASSPGAWASG